VRETPQAAAKRILSPRRKSAVQCQCQCGITNTKLWAAPVYTFRLNAARAAPDIASSSSFGVFAPVEGAGGRGGRLIRISERRESLSPPTPPCNNSICLLPRRWGNGCLLGCRRAIARGWYLLADPGALRAEFEARKRLGGTRRRGIPA